MCVCVRAQGSVRAAADAFLTLPNFKSGSSTLIFSPPALRTLGKTEERDPGSFPPLPSLLCVPQMPHFLLLPFSLDFSPQVSDARVKSPSPSPRRAFSSKTHTQPSPCRNTAGLVAAHGNSLILLSPQHTQTHTHRAGLHCECLAQGTECIRHIKS